jgi:uncharacterized protein involved in exopolysaccharide biosynthesis
MLETQKKDAKLSDYIYILYKWRKFLFINLFVIVIGSTVYAFLIPEQFKATATIMIPPENQMGVGGITSLLGGKSSIASLGSRMFGISNTSEDVLLGIINSRNALTHVIEKFNLMEYYEIDDNNWDKVLKSFTSDLSADPNEYGMIDFSVINKDPELSARIANYMVALVDSLNIKFSMEQAKNNRMFIEKRYLQNVNDLKKAEDSLYAFQKKYGIVVVPEQLEVTVKAAAELESQLIKKEMESIIIKQQLGENSPLYQSTIAEMKLLENKVQELKRSKSFSTSSNILYSFREMPDISIKYLRNYREIEIQQSILEIVMPMYEQAKVEEQKSIPTVLMIDKAVPPQLKYSPKKAVIIVGLTILLLFIMVPFIFLAEKAVTRDQHQNPIQVKGANFISRIIKLYRIKF